MISQDSNGLNSSSTPNSDTVRDLAQVENRPETLTMTVQGGMLEALGINMYTSIGKCLVEFVANSYDSNASFCEITLPFDAIDESRAKIRSAAKIQVQKGERAAFTVLLDPLPEDITIVIKDDGHGMDANEVQNKFLPLNRHRRGKRNENQKTEDGLRFAMGRKGLGKLAGFGAAERVTIRTKRAGRDYATEIQLDYTALATEEDLQNYPIKPIYYDNQPPAEHGTTITLSGLRCDALKSKEDKIRESLVDGFFGIRSDDFAISLNEREPLAPIEAYYEFEFPSDSERDKDGFGTHVCTLEDGETFDLRYIVKFRGRSEDEHAAQDYRERGSLPAKRRGARVYCNKRLAAGPTLFDLKTGMHNFHSQAYMECIVEADELDQHEVDLINTNRSDFRRDNEIVDKFVTDVTELMRKALYEHGRFRDELADEQLLENEDARKVMTILDHVSPKQKTAARAVLKKLASEYGVRSEGFKETAPLIINSMNAGAVLIKLMDLGINPDDLPTIAGELLKLRAIEKNDALKLYKGRRSGIAALQRLMVRADEEWKGGNRFESELHDLLKSNPWLVRAEYNDYLSSNQSMATVTKQLSQVMEVDGYSGDAPDPKLRPDLVAVLQDSIDAHTVVIIELKSPNIALDQDALSQLERYVAQVRDVCKTELHKPMDVKGFLIGTLPDATAKNYKERVLLDKYAEQGPDSELQIVTLHDMLQRSLVIYVDAIRAIEIEENDAAGQEAEAPS